MQVASDSGPAKYHLRCISQNKQWQTGRKACSVLPSTLVIDRWQIMKMCAGMEAAIANMLEPGETIVVGNNGIWGERACEIADRYGGLI